jgi:hypothetical protein
MEDIMIVRRTLLISFIIALALSACSVAGENVDAMVKEDEVMMEDETTMIEDDDTMEDGHDETMASDDEMMEDSSSEMMVTPDWFKVDLVDVNSGETFRIEDLQGKVVLVETMAVWCSNCLRQQREVQDLHAAMGERDDFVSIALDIDPNEDAAKLRGFAEQQGFDWKYVVAPVAVASEIGELYGQQFLNPPSTPILLIDRHGEVEVLPFGIKGAAELQASVEALLDAEM